MLQYTGENGHTVGGIGADLYNDGASCSRVSLDFDMAGAGPVGKGVNFSYFSLNEYCNLGQVTYPYINANTRTGQAATESRYTGILVHPFGAEYGYPAYDYDYWYYNGYLPDDQHWQSGWSLNGFWGYFRADNWRVPVPSADFDNDPDAAMFGVTYEPLLNHQVQGFVFEPGFVVHQFDGEPRYMDCGCAPCANNVNRKAK
jgi:hypothetical protein